MRPARTWSSVRTFGRYFHKQRLWVKIFGCKNTAFSGKNKKGSHKTVFLRIFAIVFG